ncbi:MAG: thiaminase II [Tissierellia bacterium]|nr:thiaminase II [Tissierellia bacterium]
MSFSHNLKENCKDIWEKCYNHPFLRELGEGVLDKDKFKFYLIQDYHYLLEYAKVYALAVVKTDDNKLAELFTKNQEYLLLGERKLHLEYMKKFNVTDEQLKNTPSSLLNKAYTANMFDVGIKGDLCQLLATVFPCAWTYGDFGKRLKQEFKGNLENNYFKSWIETYSSDEFNDGYEWFFDTMDNLVADKDDNYKKKIIDIFRSSVEFEYLFWQMAYNMEMSYL